MKILAIAPTRISLFGGGTDIESYASQYGGVVLNMAINLRQYITMYSDNDLFELHDNTFPYNASPDFYYRILEEYKINDGVHLTKLACKFDGLIESGIGSSASAAVALIGAINKRLKLKMSLTDIAEKAWEIEVKKYGLFGGKQDQYAASFGGLSLLEFGKTVNRTVFKDALARQLASCIVLLYTGANRQSAKIQEGLKKPSSSQLSALHEVKKIAMSSLVSLWLGDMEAIGYLLNRAWEWKKKTNKVSNTHLDLLYEQGKKLGAWGGKVCGAGGGGYMMFMLPPEKKQVFIEKMKLDWWDFNPDFNGLEVTILSEH